MLNKDYTAKLLKLEDVIITNVLEKSTSILSCPEKSTAVPPAGPSRAVCTTTGCRHGQGYSTSLSSRPSFQRYFLLMSSKGIKTGLLWHAEFFQFQKENSVLPYIKIVPERFTPTRPYCSYFVSTPTIDIEPKNPAGLSRVSRVKNMRYTARKNFTRNSAEMA